MVKLCGPKLGPKLGLKLVSMFIMQVLHTTHNTATDGQYYNEYTISGRVTNLKLPETAIIHISSGPNIPKIKKKPKKRHIKNKITISCRLSILVRVNPHHNPRSAQK